ncbi:MAG: STAS domain-containing protein [Saprospiraceae bacterium]|nr:STAS domain-containing protein [Saprospiraceae bacterium]
MGLFNLKKANEGFILEVATLINENENKTILTHIKNELNASEEKPQTLTVDLTHLRLLNSTGISFLIVLLNSCKKTGVKLLIKNPSERLLKVLEVTKLHKFFEFIFNHHTIFTIG